MSAYSTLLITRSKAKQVVFDRLLNISDQELEEMMDRILDERLYNSRIVSDDEPNDDDVI